MKPKVLNFVKTTQFDQQAAVWSIDRNLFSKESPFPLQTQSKWLQKHIYITTHLNILPSLLQVTLKIDEKEVDYALQDKTLLSSILQEGMPTTSWNHIIATVVRVILL